EAEIGDHRPIVTIDQDIRRLEITVQDAVVVREVDGSANSGQVASGVARRQRSWLCAMLSRAFQRWTACEIVRLRKHATQGCAFDVLHRKESLAVTFTHIIDGNNIWMLQPGGRLRFGAKANQ